MDKSVARTIAGITALALFQAAMNKAKAEKREAAWAPHAARHAEIQNNIHAAAVEYEAEQKAKEEAYNLPEAIALRDAEWRKQRQKKIALFVSIALMILCFVAIITLSVIGMLPALIWQTVAFLSGFIIFVPIGSELMG
jgi:hypothetical protein